MPSQNEINRRYQNIRARMAADNLDALIICGNQYAGFEGAVLYTSGFEIVHRYVYVLLPLGGEPTLVFPREARWIGDKQKPWVKDQVWPDVPGQWLRDRAIERKWKRVGVYGLNFVMEKYLPENRSAAPLGGSSKASAAATSAETGVWCAFG